MHLPGSGATTMRAAADARPSVAPLRAHANSIWMFLVLLVSLPWPWRRPIRGPPALTHKPSPVSLLGARPPRSPPQTQPPPWRSFTMIWDWRWLYTEVGTVAMVSCVASGAWQMTAQSVERAVHLHLVLGLSKGFSLLIICLIVLAQALASATLLVPVLYLTTGAIVPSLILATTLWFEAFVFGDATDQNTVMRISFLSIAAAMLALFRFDRASRNSQAQLPTSSHLLMVEANVKQLCTTARTGICCPPLAAVVFLSAVFYSPYWKSSGVVAEFYRNRFHAQLSLVSLLFLLAGQDTRAHVYIGEKLERLYDVFMARKESLLGQPRVTRWLGAKKAL